MEKQQGWGGASITNLPRLAPPEKIAIVWMSARRDQGEGREKEYLSCGNVWRVYMETRFSPTNGVVTEWLRCYV